MALCQTDITETKNLLRGLHVIFWQHKSSSNTSMQNINHRNTVQGQMNTSNNDSRTSLLSTSLALQGDDNMISDLNRFKVIISICTLFSIMVDVLHQIYNDDETIEEEGSMIGSQSVLSLRSAQDETIPLVSTLK